MDVEQNAFATNIVPGLDFSPDKVLQRSIILTAVTHNVID